MTLDEHAESAYLTYYRKVSKHNDAKSWDYLPARIRNAWKSVILDIKRNIEDCGITK